MKRLLLAGALLALLPPAAASAQDTNSMRSVPAAEKREETIRVQVSVNIFLAGPTGDSDEAVKLRDRATRAVYEMASGECFLVEKTFAKSCKLDQVTVNVTRQANIGVQVEGYLAAGIFAMRAVPK